jgi:hypothetical protein
MIASFSKNICQNPNFKSFFHFLIFSDILGCPCQCLNVKGKWQTKSNKNIGNGFERNEEEGSQGAKFVCKIKLAVSEFEKSD